MERRGVICAKKAKSNGEYPPDGKEVTAMGKDGTARGGQRAGAGRKSKALMEKVDAGNPGGRKLTVMDIPEMDSADLEAVDTPSPKEYLSAVQRDGKPLIAGEVYRETRAWLKKVGCDHLVNPQQVEQYAMSVARWLQCEEALTKYGLIAKHPTTNNPIASPYVTMSQNYMKQTNQAWWAISQIVKENCQVEYQGSDPQSNVMELLLRARKG